MPTFRCGVCEAFNAIAEPASGTRCKACESLLDQSGKPQPVDAAALSRAIELSPVPLFVDFWATWCGPCVWSAPIVKAMAARLAGEIVVLTLNTHDSPQAGEQHAIYAIPTFALFRGGEELSRRMGLMSRADLEDWLRRELRLHLAPVANGSPGGQPHEGARHQHE
jgi:thioredoxin 2